MTKKRSTYICHKNLQVIWENIDKSTTFVKFVFNFI